MKLITRLDEGMRKLAKKKLDTERTEDTGDTAKGEGDKGQKR